MDKNVNIIFSTSISNIKVIMPIGISFFTFQALSYVIDVYRGNVAVQKRLDKMVLYISFFPQLIAGPIVRYYDFQGYIEKRSIDTDDVIYGLERFIVGLAKKTLLANTMGALADNIYKTGVTGIDITIAWVGAIAYTLQIFFDFSGYSDMAIGLGRMFGFHFLENFNYPYISKSITEFWRRWHISLSTWFKEYLYIPLGGNRAGKSRMYINLCIVFLLTGFWHGASWNFIIWGFWHGLFIILEKKFDYTDNQKIPNCILHIYAILVVVIGWIFFRADNLSIAIKYISIMFGLSYNEKIPFTLAYYLTRKEIIVGAIAIICSVPWVEKTCKISTLHNNWIILTRRISMLLLLIASMVSIAASSYNPFIYFRF